MPNQLQKQNIGQKILLAEDSELNLLLLEEMLSTVDACLDAVYDGAKALEMAKVTKYDIILLDLNMPHMSGEAVAKAIKHETINRETPIVGITAALPNEIQPGLQNGTFHEILFKPLHKTSLLAAIAKYSACVSN